MFNESNASPDMFCPVIENTDQTRPKQTDPDPKDVRFFNTR